MEDVNIVYVVVCIVPTCAERASAEKTGTAYRFLEYDIRFSKRIGKGSDGKTAIKKIALRALDLLTKIGFGKLREARERARLRSNLVTALCYRTELRFVDVVLVPYPARDHVLRRLETGGVENGKRIEIGGFIAVVEIEGDHRPGGDAREYGSCMWGCETGIGHRGSGFRRDRG